MKGYMIFVEGMNAPKVVHEEYKSARGHAHFLAKRNPGKTVTLLQISKRMRYDENGNYEKMATHTPSNTPQGGKLHIDSLVMKSVDSNNQ